MRPPLSSVATRLFARSVHSRQLPSGRSSTSHGAWSVVIGGSGSTAINLSTATGVYYPTTVRSNDGGDTVQGALNWVDSGVGFVPGSGADVVQVGGSSWIRLADGVTQPRASDTVVVSIVSDTAVTAGVVLATRFSKPPPVAGGLMAAVLRLDCSDGKAALEALSNIGAGNIAVTGKVSGTFNVGDVVTLVINGNNYVATAGAKDANGGAFAGPVSALVARGVRFEVCEITLKNRSLKKEQFSLDADFTPSGVVRIAKLQRQGAAYIKP